jgi:LacI family transcriptional regulator
VQQRRKKPTISDVAREAGMGVMTVSRVLNDHRSVSDKARKRVLAAIAKIGYRPSEAAQLLAGQKSKTIGLIVPDISDTFFASCCHKVQEVARSYGYLTLIVASERSEAVELELADHMASRRVAGLLIVPSAADGRRLRALYPPETPIVALDRPLVSVDSDAVVAENREGADQAVRHLIGHGHHHIICIGYDENVYTIHERIEAYTHAMRSANLRPRYYGQVDSLEALRLLMKKLLKEKARPTAIFCLNHRTTAHTLQVMRMLGQRIPQDMAIIGFDDLDLGVVLTPSLTAVYQSPLELGRRGATLLFERIRNFPTDIGFAKIVLPAKLIIRESCGCTSPPYSPDN